MESFRKYMIIQETDAPHPGKRFYIGIAILFTSFFMLPVGILIHEEVASHFWKNFVLAAFWVSAPVMKIISIAILGKPSYLWIKSKFKKLMINVIKPYHNNMKRYRAGLILFCLPFIPNYFMAYAPRIFEHDFRFRIILNIITDIIWITSLFVLGGDFWDKVKALFDFSARVVFDKKEESPGTAVKAGTGTGLSESQS